MHTIIIDDPMNPNEPPITPLALKGVTSYFQSRKPKESEYEDESTPYIDMKRKAPVWEPSETGFSEQEDTMNDFRGEVISSDITARGRQIINLHSTSEDDVVYFMDDDNLYNALNAKVNVARVGASKGINGVTLESLSQKWLVSTETERQIVHNVTH